jgi:hypothetical protein
MRYRDLDEMIIEAQEWGRKFIDKYLREMNGDRNIVEEIQPNEEMEVENANLPQS